MKHRLAHLDMLRGLAAFLVLVEHLRALLLVPISRLHSAGLGSKFLYFTAGLGHQAVMVFFVLSGFLVGGSVISAHQKGRWSWTNYSLRRLTRLWVVLIPALLLTLFWDGLGQHQFAIGYGGGFQAVYDQGPHIGAPADLSPATFFGNAFYLQTIFVPCYGTNNPLWSLANEFWYYLLFPLFYLAIARASHVSRGVAGSSRSGRLSVYFPRRIAFVSLFVVLCNFLPTSLLWGGCIWLMGVGGYLLHKNEHTRCWVAHPMCLVSSVCLFLVFLAASHTANFRFGNDFFLGASVALLVAGLAGRPVGPGIYSRAAAGISAISFTLYVVHFPALAYLFFVYFRGHQMAPGPEAAIIFESIIIAVITYAAIIWWCFERNTDRLRARIEAVVKAMRKPTPRGLNSYSLNESEIPERVVVIEDRKEQD